MFKILLVDDEPFVREGLRLLLERKQNYFHICGQAENGRAALEMINEMHPEVVITDVKMPLMDGLELIKTVREKNEVKTKFIILSGYNEFEYAKTAIKYNVKDYILKPIDIKELVETLKELHEELEEENSEDFENIIRNIINGEFDEALLKKAEKKLAIHDYTNIFKDLRYVEIEFNPSAMMTLEEKLEVSRKKIEDFLGNENTANIIEENNIQSGVKSFGIITTFNILKAYSSNIKDFINLIYDNFTNCKGYYVSVYVGKTIENIAELRESYDSVAFLKKYKFFRGKNNILFYDDIKNRSFSNSFGKRLIFDNLVEAIENGNKEAISDIAGKISDEIMMEFIDPEVIKININYLVCRITAVVAKMGGETEKIMEYYKKQNSNAKLLTVEEVKNILIEFSTICSEYFEVLCQRQSKGMITRIEKFINDNYNKSINLKTIANSFFINSAYLGQLFKKNFGVSFNKYLNQIRIERAKEFLMSTDMKIYEISEAIGYKDCDYFIAKFEEKVGVTPYQYRKMRIKV